MPKLRNVFSSNNIEDRRAADPIASLFLARPTDPIQPSEFYDRFLPQATPEAAGSELSKQLGYEDVGKSQLLDPTRTNKSAVYPGGVSPALYDALVKHSPEVQERIDAYLKRK